MTTPATTPADGELLTLPAPHETDTPRVEACIQDAMRRFPGYSASAQARYYEEVHQDLAPLACDLERELAAAHERIRELERATPSLSFAAPEDGYGETDFGYTLAGIELEEGDKRLMAMLVKAFGTDHPAVDDLVALIWRSPATPSPGKAEAESPGYFEIRVGGLQVAATSGPRERAMQEATRYFRQYAFDATGDEPVELIEVVHIAEAPPRAAIQQESNQK